MSHFLRRLYQVVSVLVVFVFVAEPVGVAMAAHLPDRATSTLPAYSLQTAPLSPGVEYETLLPLVLENYRPPAPVQAIIEPGIGGEIGSPDGRVHVYFDGQAVTETVRVMYIPVTPPALPPDDLAVGGPAFQLSAETLAGIPVSDFPPLVTIIPGTEITPAITIITPTVTLEYRYTNADVWGLDLREFFLYTRQPGVTEWLRAPSAAYPDQNLLWAELNQLGDFVPMAPLSAGGLKILLIPTADEVRLALDPDDNVGHGYWPGVGTLWEGPKAFALAQELQTRLQQNDCHLGILVTRDAGQQSGYVSRSLRAQLARNFEANLFVTLAFNGLTGYPWGWQGDGGVNAWARSGHPQDDALGNQFFDNVQTYTGRPHTRGIHHPSLYAEFNNPSLLPSETDYAHIEVLFLDHNYDAPVIINNFNLIVDAAYAALVPRLTELGVTCGQDHQPPQPPAPPSADVLKRLRDLGYQNYQRYGADPVSFSTGNHVVQVPLFRLPGRGSLDAEMILTYNSQDGRSDLFGAGWNSSYNSYVQRYSDDSASVTLADGRTYYFPWNGGGYDAGAGVYERLEKTGDGWELTFPDQTAYTFQETVGGLGILTQIRDLNGNTLEFAYDLSGQDDWQDGNPVPRPPLTEMRDTAGRFITFENVDSRITAIHLFDGRTFRFAYDGDGNLTGITNAKGDTRHYAYDGRHRMTQEWDEAGILFLQSTYDDRNRVVGQVDASGSDNSIHYDPVQRLTTYTDNQGKTQVYRWDDQNRVTSEEDGLGNASHTEYDANNNPLSVTDARGFITEFVYDERGNLLERRDPVDGTSGYLVDVSTWVYNDLNLPTSYTNALGHTWSYQYDSHGNLLKTIAPDTSQTSATYNAWGQPFTITDALNRTTTYTYDNFGHLVQVEDALHGISSWTYDASGRQTSYTDANEHTVHFAYDANDNLISITDPRGAVSTFEYDQNNLLVRSVDRRGGETRYEYDENLKLTGERDPEGHWTHYTYDANYNRATMTDANGHLTQYFYDENNRLERIVHPNGGEMHYEYDATGNLSTVTDAEGGQTHYTYDSMNRIKYQTDAAGNTTEYCYDAEDQLVRIIGPRHEVWNYGYDEVGNLVQSIDPYAKITHYEYDAAGNRTAAITPLGFRSDFEYDALDRLLVVRQPMLPGGQRPVTTYTYDAVGNVLTITNPRGFITEFEYDENDNLKVITDPLGGQTHYEYDAEDNPVRVANPRGFAVETRYNGVNLPYEVEDAQGGVTSLEYDGVYNLIARTDPLNRTTHFEYDSMRQLIRTTDPMGNITQYERDLLGRLICQTDGNGNPTEYGYDALGRLVEVVDALDGHTSYTYDPAGNLASITDANGNVTHFEYNLLNQLKREVNPLDKVWEYSYDADGRLARRVDALWRATYYAYDSNARLSEISYGTQQLPLMEPVTFDYDLAGNQTGMCDALGCATNTYDALDRLEATTDWLSRTITHTYDATGNLTGLIYPNGNEAGYSYSPNDWLIAFTDPQGSVATFTHDEAGEVTRILRPNVTQTDLVYDGSGRLLNLENRQSVSSALHSAYQYTLDAAGNRLRVIETRAAFDGSPDPVTLLHDYGYDALNRLVSAQTAAPQTETDYTFDAVGNRLNRSGLELAPDPGTPTLPVAPNPVDTIYTYNAANQMLAAGDTAFDYNDNGDRTRKTEVITDGLTSVTNYAFDREDRMTGATTYLSSTAGITVTMVATYTYDGYGRRALREVTTFEPVVSGTLTNTITGTQFISATQVFTYLYNGLDVIGVQMAERGVSVTTTVSETYFYLAPSPLTGLWRPFEMERLPNAAAGFPGDRHWYETDGLDSTTNLTDDAGDAVSPYLYDEYGRLLAGDAELQALMFTAQEYDPETGLVHFYARYYDPEVGVWVSQDNYRGKPQVPNQLNRYSYSGNNPILYVDPIGFDRTSAGNGVTKPTGGETTSEQPPDLTEWLINQIIINTYITWKLFNLDNLLDRVSAMFFFYENVKTGGKWDYKSNVLKEYSTTGIILCGKVYANDVPGNIVYGYMGLYVGFWKSLLRDAAGFAQVKKNATKNDMLTVLKMNFERPYLLSYLDDPYDQNAIKVGFGLYEQGLSKENLARLLESSSLRKP